jgi:hypothetical protein
MANKLFLWTIHHYVALWHDYDHNYSAGTAYLCLTKYVLMKNVKLFALAVFLGLFITAPAGYTAERLQERQEQERQGQERQEKEGQEKEGQEKEHPDQEELFGIDGLPQTVREALMENYEDWVPVEAKIETDEEEGTFYEVLLTKADEDEAKLVKITREGEVLDEQEADMPEPEVEKEDGHRRER